MKIKITIALIFLGSIAFVFWYFFIALKPQQVSLNDIKSAYAIPSDFTPDVTLNQIDPFNYKVSFESFDGAVVNGQISFPVTKSEKYPLAMGVSAMGRNYNRWWIDSYKGRPTISNVNKLGSMLLNNGYVLVAIDARLHGSRKDPELPLQDIMNDLHFFGNRTPYQNMITNTVKDYRVLFSWLKTQKFV
ncbi:MAG: hypothetical protein OQJ89_05215, partial [Kangiellaceae bacterium]|nr:hypothetical protein [Kangiellaceae bacterium]